MRRRGAGGIIISPPNLSSLWAMTELNSVNNLIVHDIYEQYSEFQFAGKIVIFQENIFLTYRTRLFFFCFSQIRQPHTRDQRPKTKALVLSLGAGYTRLREQKKTYWAREDRETVADFGRVLEEKGARYRPRRVYNVFSVRARAFMHLSPPCGPLSCSLVLKTAPSRVQCVFLPCGVRLRPLSCSVVR